MKRTDMDNHSRYSRKWKNSLTAGVLLALALGGTGYAMPAGGQIQSGQGAIAQNGKNMTVTQNSGKMAVDWTQFNIARDEAVKFAQPGRDAVALNRITGGQKSVIDGALSANGNLLLVNPNGVVFGKTATVDVGSLVASTAQLNDPFMKSFAGSTANLNLTIGDGNTSAILNEGTIAAQGGLVALHAAQVENTGTISNPGGTVALAAARQLTLSPDGDGKLNYAVDGELARAKALNSGKIQADGGYVVMTAKSAQDLLGTVVNNTGTIEAKTLRKDEKGQILLDGGQSGQVEVSGTLDASGMEDGQSAGSIKVIGQKTIVHDNTNLIAQGNVDGGKIETSGDVLNLGDTLNIDAKGVNGKAGEWLLDPLDVIIADSDPTTTSNYDNADKKTATDSDFTEGSASIGYNDPDATTANASSVNSAVTWISTDMVEKRLNAGTSVTVQAAATKGSANIIVKNDIDKTAGGDATLTLDAMRNITVNGNISSTSNKLNVVLNADSNGDQIGAVIINGNINTNGGDFTSASGGTVTYTSDEAETRGYGNGKLTGKADPEGHTVGTYFGHVDSSGTADGTKDDRLIKTGGGNITLNGEIAIGLNGGTLTLDSGGGAVTATGIINSGNSYGAYVYGTDTWNTLVEKTVEEYLKEGTVPAYHYQGVNYVKDASGNYVKNADGTYQYTTDAQSFSNGQPHYTFSEADTQNVRWLGDGSATSVSTSKGTGYASVVITKGSMTLEQWLNYQLTYNAANFANRYISQDSGVKIVTEKVGNKTNTYVRNADGSNVTTAQFKTYLSTALTNLKSDTASTDTTKMLNGETVYNNLKDDISHLLATNWFASKELAQGNTKGGSAAGDSYLATITTILENSLTTPNGQQILWAGGRGSGVLNKTGSTNNDKAYPYSYYGMPDDPTYQDGMYWVTGPEGEVNNGKGTQFYSNTNSNWKTGNYGKTVYGYVNWDTYNDGNKTRSQPDNSAPFLTVGYGTTGKWDDAAMGGDTTVGFIKETNLANSSLNIKAGSGTVNLEGDLGKAKALDTVNIESTGTVTLGNPNNTATTYHNGTVYADHGVYISGGTVSVGGEIHSGTTDTTASASDITTRSDGYQNTAFQLDSVTIKSAGDLTVHGVESDGYTGSDNALNGGKISLTSTGDTGKITLGAGVDYNGKATDGTLAAASAEKGAVVVDAQGSKGSLVNSTTGTAAITTGEKGTWQVYVNSPSDYGTSLGGNLNSSTNAQWTAKSDANSVVTSNGVGNKLNKYTDTSSNKFIFQVTPVITISGGYTSKTYGDTLSKEKMAETLTSKAAYKDSKGSDIDVTDFKNNFDESNYLDYVTNSDSTKKGLSTVNVSSEGAAQTAVRTNGNEKAEGSDAYKTATDNNRAFYVMDVTYQDGVKTLNGYDKAANPGEVEITRKTLTINTDATQTYGNADVTSRTTKDYSAQLMNGDKLDAGDITYTIATDDTYATSKGSNDTAHVGSYENQYLTTGATVKASDGSDASANYAVTGSGTITVNPADLYLTVGNVSTTYGTAFDDTQYGYTVDDAKGGLVNGDTKDAVLGNDFLSYTNNGNATDPDKIAKGAVTQNVGKYALQGTSNRTLADYNVHITSGTATVNKAKLTLTVGDTSTTYGTSDWTPYTYTLSGNTNGDLENDVRNHQIEVSYSNSGEKSDPNNSAVKTQNAGDYDLTGTFNLKGDTAKNYKIDEVNSDLTGKATVKKATVKVKLNDVSTTYGTAFDTSKYGYDTSSIEGLTNGDGSGVVTSALDGTYGTGDITYTNTGDASSEEQKTGKVTKTVNGGPYYLEGSTNQTLDNYNIEIENGNATINKATLHLFTGDYTEAYGDAGAVQKDLDSATMVKGEKNGDSLVELTSKIGITNTSGALVSKDRTNDVKYKTDGSLDSYGITTDFNKSLDNYDVVQDKAGSVTLTPVEVTVDNEMVQTYGSKDRSFKEVVVPGLVNGDKISTDGLKMAPKAGGKYETNKGNRTTADAGKYKDDLAFSGGGIVHADGMTDASKNYKVTIKGDIIVNKADLTVNTKDVTTPFGTVKFTTSGVQGLTNGDEKNVSDLKFNYGSYGNAYLDNNSYTNAPGRYEFTTETTNQHLDFLKNYNILGGDAAVTITPVDKPVKPDITPDRPNPVPEGKGEVEEPSMDDFRGEEEHRDGGRTWYREKKSIPFFKVLDGKVTNYGTFDVESMPEKVEITPSGMRLPEPDQPETQHREYTTTLTLPGGDGSYRLVYNGVSFNIHAVDTAARQLLEAGDPKKNEELSEAALHTGFQKMGLGLEDLKAVYVRFN